VEDDRGVLHALHCHLERRVLEGHDDLRLRVARRVHEAGQRGEVALRAEELEGEVASLLQPLLLHADADRVLAPLAADPVGGADDGDDGDRTGGRAGSRTGRGGGGRAASGAVGGRRTLRLAAERGSDAGRRDEERTNEGE
jgi:hypothetical protein